MKDFIKVYDDYYTDETCQEYIDWIEHYINHGVMFKEEMDERHKRDHFTLNYNNDPIYNCLAGDNMSLHFLPSIKEAVDDYLKEYSVLGRETLLFYDTKVKKIPIGGGFHDWHYENPYVTTAPRKLVVQAYLNTIEEGGETEFLYINKRIKAERGRLIVFPAAFTHTHRGNPPIGKDKYIISSWGVSQDNL